MIQEAYVQGISTRSVDAPVKAIMDEAETDVLAYMTFPGEHRVQLYSTDPSNG